MFGFLYAAEHVKLTLVLSLSITALIILSDASPLGLQRATRSTPLTLQMSLTQSTKVVSFKKTFENHFERNVDNNHSPIDALFPPRRARCVHRWEAFQLESCGGRLWSKPQDPQDWTLQKGFFFWLLRFFFFFTSKSFFFTNLVAFHYFFIFLQGDRDMPVLLWRSNSCGSNEQGGEYFIFNFIIFSEWVT